MLPGDLYSNWDDTQVRPVQISTVTKKAGKDQSLSSVSAPPCSGALAEHTSFPDQSTTGFPADMPFSNIIAEGVQNGFRHFFRLMSCQLADYRVLCKTLNTLGVDVVKQRRLQDVVKDLKTGDDDYDPEERMVIKVSKRGARNAAFTLLYLFLVEELESPGRDGPRAYNAVLYIVSHRRKFKYRTRKMVREAFESRFMVTHKQRVGLDKWPIATPQREGGQDTEGTTEEETFDHFMDSDWSD
ncbi:hypothetical protein QQZ08_003744 [Neonectria magnoliae]|uniref:Uncharacterized protein n=1 Tax=Neonectria magnoliae TaxID=2732573 RepID=A0ABR1I7Z6_9HYPO